MFKKVVFLTNLSLCAAALVFQGCASKPENYQAFAEATDPSVEITNLKSSLDRGREENVHTLAPDTFAKAQKEYDAAVEAQSSNKDNVKVLDRIARANAYLVQARNLASVAQNSFEKVLKTRQAAITAGAHESHKAKFQQGEAALREASEEMEDGDLKVDVKVVERLEKPYREAELSAIKENYVGVSMKQLDTAKNEGAEKITPNVWVSAVAKFRTAEAAIDQDRYNSAAIKPLADAANSEATLVLKMTRDAKVAAKKSPEELAVAAHQAESKIEDLSSTVQSDKARLSTLESSEAIEQKITAVRARFSPQEAEVLREGDKVLIRLKSIRFPSNESNLSEKQFPVLAKVQDAVKVFGDKKVVVEGHTDSVGGKTINQELSEKRAALVESYLVNNGAVGEDQIEAKGFGYQKPITTNKTAQGRAQNRRIDVVIEL